MAVTRRARRPKQPTQRLVEFLNFNYATDSKEAFLQKEIRRFILALLLSKPDLIEFHLGRLFGEINRIRLRPYWAFTSVAVASNGLRFGERHLRIQNTKWIVSKRTLAGGTRESVFQDILSSMEAGDFGLLRRCPICQTFFVANDFRQGLCGSVPCKRKQNNDTARKRVAKKRERDREVRTVSLDRAAKSLFAINDRRGFECFREYMKLREKRNRSPADEDHLLEVTRRLPRRNQTPIEWDKEMKKEVTLADLWERFPSSVRSVFLAIVRSNSMST
jgi:hypothetical protein